MSPDTLAADVHLVDGIAPRPDASRPLHVHVVVEIPAGTQAKWEVTKTGGVLAWERTDGGRRVIRYLPYPANYGLVPQTLSPRSDGGDGDPLDVVVLGTALPRGSVVTARVIGVLRLLDEGERDDKLIAVPIAPEDAAFSPLPDVEALRAQRPGALTILETWFSNYDGPGVTTSGGVDGADAARSILDIGIDAYSTSR